VYGHITKEHENNILFTFLEKGVGRKDNKI
jgi:hypothetical protein